jgi:hypothetical protein
MPARGCRPWHGCHRDAAGHLRIDRRQLFVRLVGEPPFDSQRRSGRVAAAGPRPAFPNRSPQIILK